MRISERILQNSDKLRKSQLIVNMRLSTTPNTNHKPLRGAFYTQVTVQNVKLTFAVGEGV